MTIASARSHTVVRDAVKLHHLDWGDENKPPIVLVHGSRLHAHVWDDFGRRFSDRYHIIALDQRGHGDSGWDTSGTYQLEELYRDLRAVVQARGLSRFTLVGHSLGGRVSMVYAHRHPEELNGLVLVDITPGRPATAAPTADLSRNIEAPGPGEFDTQEAALVYLARVMSRAPRHMVEESVRHGMRKTDAGRYTWKYDPALVRGRVQTPPGFDLWSMMSTVPTTTLLQYGSHSNVVNAELAARLEKTMPRCTVERVEGAGHGLFTDRPDAFAESVERFLSGRGS
jgi:pimeloyl-ACP methyl ester carboxylesterase